MQPRSVPITSSWSKRTILAAFLMLCHETPALELTDRSQLSPGNTEIDFDDQTLGVAANPLTISGLTFSSVENLHIYQPSADGYSPPADLVSGRLLRANPDVLFSFPYSDIRINFATPVAEVGFSWWDATFGDNAIEVYDSQGQLLESALFPSAGSGGSVASFAGIRRSSNEIAYAIARVSAANEVGGIDKISYGFTDTGEGGAGGKEIAYVADFELWLMEADGSGKTALGLSATDFDALDVQLSPGGDWLVFTGINWDTFENGLWLMRAEPYNALSNAPQLVGPDASYLKRASWHPAGGQVAYIGNDNKVYLVQVLNDQGEPVIDTPESLTDDQSVVWVTDCAFSPNGRDLLVCQFGADLAFLEVFDESGNRTASVIGSPLPPITSQIVGRAAWPSFSPDGKKIAFQSTKQYTGTLPGSDPPVNGFVTEIAIATLTIRDNAGALLPEHQSSNLRQYLSDPIYFIDPPMFVDNAPTWSPDGSKIVFVDYADGSPSGHKRIVSLNATAPENNPDNPRVVLAGDSSAEVDSPSFAHPGTLAVPGSLIVPGEANLWLSGQPKFTPAEEEDVAFAQSPILADITLVPGHDLVFQVFGGTHNGPDPGTTGPDGGDAANHSPENGIGPMSAPLNALVGVFVNDDTPAQPAPSLLLDFSNPDNRNLPILQPGLRQPFFIGDGLDDELNTQHFRVPEGATRLFLGSFDAFTNKGNFGQFTVIVDQVEPTSLPVLPESSNFTIIPGNSDLPWTFSIDQEFMADGLVLRVESTLDPNDPLSWTDLPTGSAMTRSGNTWVLSVVNPPIGNRYFRVVAEAPGYESSIAEFQDENEVTVPILIERPVIDTIPPTLSITHTWMEKAGKVTFFKMLLDPQDETGFDPGLSENDPHTAIEYRSVLNSTAPISGNGGWKKWGWQRGVPFSVPFDCKAVVFEIRAIDAAGNKSPIQRRTFKVPFPYGPPPNLEPKFTGIVPLAGDDIDCRGLYATRFDDEGPGDDVLQIDRTTGEVRVRRQGNAGAFTDNSFFLTPNSINDSAIGDFDSDGRPDIAIVVDGTLKVFRNDGVDGGGELQFSEIGVGGLAGAGIANVMHCAVGNVTSDGWPDIVITGTGDDGMGGTVTKVAVIINTPDFHLTGANNAVAPAGTDPGLVRLGDVDGDGWLDAVMVDAAGNRLITFRNKQNGGFGSATESDPEFAAKTVVTGFPPLPAQALAMGDVTGDGRADAVVVMHWFAATGGDPNDHRDHQMWQLLDARPDGSLRANAVFEVSQGPQGVGPTDFRSDVTLSDVNGDRFPELIFTSQFEAPTAPGGSSGGVLVVRIDSNLDPSNALIGFQSHETGVPTNAAHPHRLATGRHGNTGQRDIVLANGSTPSLQWILNRYSKLSKPLEIQGGLYTESDPDGTELPNGILTYTAYPGEFIDYTVSYANNTPNTLTDATIDCVLPPTLESPPVQADPGHQILVAKAARIIRWTETLPPGAAGVKQFRVRILPTAKIGTPIAPINVIRKGKTAASSLMPNLKIEHPLSFEYTSVSTGPNPFGLINPPHSVPIGDPTGRTAHLGDPIRWRIKLRNRASIPLQNIKIQVSMPRGVKFDGPVHAIPGMTYQVTPLVANDRNPTPTQIAFTIPTMAPFSSTDDLFFIDGTVEEDPGLTVPRDPKGRPVMNPGFQIKMQPTVEAPDLPKRAEAAFISTLSPTLGIEIYANKEAVSPGETIDYTVVARNWGSADLQNARVVNEIPLGSKLVSVRTRDTGGGGVHFDDSPLDADSLSPSPSTIAPGLLAGAWPTLVWDLGTVPGGAHRIMRYTVVVGADVPTTIPIAGQPNPVKIINGTYNFTGFFSATHAAAFLPANPKVAAVPSAAAVTQLPRRNGAKAVASALSSDNPQSLPSLTVRKRILGPRDESLPSDFKYPFLASEEKNGTEHFYLTNTRSSSLDGVMSYYFEVQNTGTSTAHNVYVHDLIPANVQFQGWVARDGNLVSSFSKFRFYEGLRGIQLDNGHEPFSDNNGSGQWEFPETFEDKNGNRRFDGLESIRRLSLWVGDLAPGQTATFIYQVKLIGEPKPGTLIISEGGSTSIPPKTIPNGLTYLLKEGYYLTANELHYPVFAQISKVVAEVSEPLRNILPDIHPRSREGLDDNQEIEIGIPYAISGAPGIRVVGSQMTFDVPAGYEVLGVRLVAKDAHGDLKTVRKFVKSAAYERPATPTWPGDDTAPAGSITTALVKGLTRVTVPLNDPTRPSPLTDPTNPLAKGDVRASVVFLHCRIDPAKAALLRGTKGESAGYTLNPLRVVPVISGGRPVVNASGFAFLQEQLRQLEPTAVAGGLPSLALAGGLTVFQAATGGAVGVGTPVAPSSSEVLLDVRSDTEKDAKVFVGRCAPIAVREGNEFTIVIYSGNLTERNLGSSYLKFAVPPGCEAIRATAPLTNAVQIIGNQPPREYGGTTVSTLHPKAKENWVGGNLEYSWSKPLPAGTGVYWNLISSDPSQVDCVTITLRALPGTAGKVIEGKTCELLVANAMDKSLEPVGITVIKGDWTAEQGRAVQGAIEGAGFQLTSKGENVLRQSFTPRETSCTITFGGANLLQLKPNSHGKAASLIPLPFDRVFAIGHPDMVSNYQRNGTPVRELLSTPNLRIVVGPGTKHPTTRIPNGVVVNSPTGQPSGIYAANELFNRILNSGLNEFGTLFLAGGGSVVDGGAGTLDQAATRPVPVTPPRVIPGTNPVTTQLSGQVKLDATFLVPANTAPAGPTDVIVNPGGTPIVAGGGGNVLSHNKSAVVANDGAGVVANDGAGLIGDGAGTLIGNDAANLIGSDAASLIGQDGAALAPAGEHIPIVAGGGLN